MQVIIQVGQDGGQALVAGAFDQQVVKMAVEFGGASHIACLGGAAVLLANASRGPGILYTYGAYKRGGEHTAPSNEAFDAWLKERDPNYGVRDMEEVEAAANVCGLRLSEIIEMPANNFSLVFER